ncbi:hypothetical protein ACU5AX_09085 [Sphingomonas sp. XXL09]|uniref:hypothetical protein n=1 Tax=Sphingomonas sp. XXL09 TaxID=3457787 RepID=UPI00406BAFBF
MTDELPGFGVGFMIDAGDSIAQLAQLDALMKSTEAKILGQALAIEKATKGMIDVADSSANVRQLADTTAKATADMKRDLGQVGAAKEALDRALANTTVSTTGPAASGEQAKLTREINTTEKAIERLVAQMDREAAAIGRTRQERQTALAEELRAQAAAQGNTDAVERLAVAQRTLGAARTAASEEAARAAQQEAAAIEAVAQANRSAALGVQQFEAYARTKMRAYQEQQREAAAAAQAEEELARAGERLRVSVDPVYAAQQRFNHEISEARTLLGAGVVSLDDYCAKLRIEKQLLEQTSSSHGQAAEKSNALRYAYQDLGYQIQDVGAQLSTVSGPSGLLRIFSQQGGQIFDALNRISMASGEAGKEIKSVGGASEEAGTDMGGLGDRAIGVAEKVQNTGSKLGAFASFMAGPWGAAIMVGITVLGPLVAKLFDTDDAAKKAAEGLKTFQDRQSDIGNFIDTTTGKLTEQNRTLVLNAILTRQAQVAANAKAITEGRNAAFEMARKTYTAKAPSAGVGTANVSLMSMGVTDPDVQRAIRDAGGNVDKLSQSINKLATTTRPDLKKLNLDLSTQAGAAIQAQRENEKLGRELRALGGDTTALAGSTTALIDKQVALATATTPLLKARAQLAIVQQGAAAADKAGGAALVKYRQDLTAATNAVNQAEAAQKAAAAAKREGTKESNRAAAEARKEANKAAELAREAEAIEAQTRNLYALADAYGKSGGAALIAEAAVKAESHAIKEQADVTAAINRQVGLAIAQRVSDAERGTTASREQTAAQEAINAQVKAGLVPAERAAELVRDRIADLPLLAAIEAAQQRGLTEQAERATKALKDQQAARAAATGAATTASFNADDQAARQRLDELREEMRLVGMTDMERAKALTTIRATNEAKAKGYDPTQTDAYVKQQVEIAVAQQQLTDKTDAWNASLSRSSELFDEIDRSAQQAARGMADAFGDAGAAVGDALTAITGYYAQQARLEEDHQAALRKAGTDQKQIAHEQQLYAMRSSSLQIGAFGDMAAAAKGFFKEGSDGYKVLTGAEKAFRLVQFALSVRAIAQDAIETGSKIASSAARTAAHAVEAVVKAISSLPFPLNIAAGAATIAALAGIGVSVVGGLSGGKSNVTPANTGTGTVLGNSQAQSASIKNSIDALKEVDTLTNSYAREMSASLKSIDSRIGNVASLVVRSGDTATQVGVTEGFKPNAIGSVLGAIPLVGGFLSSLFGSKTDILANGLYGSAQSLGSILSGGFNAQTYADVQKTSKFLGITTGKKTSTQYGSMNPNLASQFTLILRSFSDAIGAAAVPLGQSTQEIQSRLNGFVVDIGKIDLKGLTGEQIQEKLSAVFGAAADKMAAAAFPGIERFQKVGEGAFETLVRVSSTVEAVTTALDQLGASTRSLGMDAKLGLADQFDSISDLTSAVDSYFSAFYTKEEQAAAKGAQLSKVFDSLGLAMPASLAAFRQLVEAQDLTTAAGQATYATLLKLAPAFADLKSAMDGAKSAADILSEREGLQRQLLELNGDTAAIRALDLAKLDASNRALQEQIYAIQDAQDAAKAADELRQAWTSVGDSIMDEVKRIRGLTDASGGNTFATLLGQFNAANQAARAGDQDAAKSLPALSQALLGKAADVATSRQELARIQAQTAAMLEATYGVIGSSTGQKATSTSDKVTAAAESQGASPTAAAANDDVVTEIRGLRADVDQLRRENNAGSAAIASGVNKTAKILENVTGPSGGTAVAVANG